MRPLGANFGSQGSLNGAQEGTWGFREMTWVLEKYQRGHLRPRGRSFRAQGKSFQASKVINFGPQGDHLVVLRRLPGERESEIFERNPFSISNFTPSHFLQYLSF